MEKPEIPKLNYTSQKNCNFMLNLFQTYTKKEIQQSQNFYIRKIKNLEENNLPKETILRNKDKLALLFYEEERRTYFEIIENFDYHYDYYNNNSLDQFDTEYWFNDED